MMVLALLLSSRGARSFGAGAGVQPGYVRRKARIGAHLALPRRRLLKRSREVEERAVHAGCVSIAAKARCPRAAPYKAHG